MIDPEVFAELQKLYRGLMGKANIGVIPDNIPKEKLSAQVQAALDGAVGVNDVTAAVGAALGARILSASAALDFGIVVGGTWVDRTMTVTGAVMDDCVLLGVPAAVASAPAGRFYSAWVSAADTVTVRAWNVLSPEEPVSGTFKVVIVR